MLCRLTDINRLSLKVQDIIVEYVTENSGYPRSACHTQWPPVSEAVSLWDLDWSPPPRLVGAKKSSDNFFEKPPNLTITERALFSVIN